MSGPPRERGDRLVRRYQRGRCRPHGDVVATHPRDGTYRWQQRSWRRRCRRGRTRDGRVARSVGDHGMPEPVRHDGQRLGLTTRSTPARAGVGGLTAAKAVAADAEDARRADRGLLDDGGQAVLVGVESVVGTRGRSTTCTPPPRAGARSGPSSSARDTDRAHLARRAPRPARPRAAASHPVETATPDQHARPEVLVGRPGVEHTSPTAYAVPSPRSGDHGERGRVPSCRAPPSLESGQRGAAPSDGSRPRPGARSASRGSVDSSPTTARTRRTGTPTPTTHPEHLTRPARRSPGRGSSR